MKVSSNFYLLSGKILFCLLWWVVCTVLCLLVASVFFFNLGWYFFMFLIIVGWTISSCFVNKILIYVTIYSVKSLYKVYGLLSFWGPFTKYILKEIMCFFCKKTTVKFRFLVLTKIDRNIAKNQWQNNK